jgi:hypothetical protein
MAYFFWHFTSRTSQLTERRAVYPSVSLISHLYLTSVSADRLNACLIPLRPKLVHVIFKNSVRTAKKTQHFTITKINRLTLFKEIIAVYSENHTEHINAKWSVTDCHSG